MKKTLVVVAHPNIDTSVVNQRWIAEIKKYNDRFTVHELYKVYPDWQINVREEQARIEEHSGLVLQFPLYWFNCPPLLKKWLDDVYTYGWAYGSTGKKMQDRKLGLAVSAGISKEDFSKSGRCGFTLSEILRPFEMVAKYTHASYQPIFTFHGAISVPNIQPQYTAEELEQNAKDYIMYLNQFLIKKE